MAQKANPIRDKSYTFALHTVLFCRNLIEMKKEYVLSRQLLRSGTSIGANVEEALSAPSRKDFINKLNIALKEAKESDYWLRLVQDSNILVEADVKPLLAEIRQIIALLTSIIKTSRANVIANSTF